MSANYNKKEKARDPYLEVCCEKSCFLFLKRNPIRKFCAKIGSHEKFETVVLAVIMCSSLKLVIDTYESERWDPNMVYILNSLDYLFNGLFIAECGIKITRMGFAFCEKSYLRDSWSQLDFFIVSCSIVDMSFTGVKLDFIKILRLLRTLRPLRFITHNQNMKIVVNA